MLRPAAIAAIVLPHSPLSGRGRTSQHSLQKGGFTAPILGRTPHANRTLSHQPISNETFVGVDARGAGRQTVERPRLEINAQRNAGGAVFYWTFVDCDATHCHFPLRFAYMSVQTYFPLLSFPLYVLFSVSLTVTTAVSPKTLTLIGPSSIDCVVAAPDLRFAMDWALEIVLPRKSIPTQSSAIIRSTVLTSLATLALFMPTFEQSFSICVRVCSTPCPYASIDAVTNKHTANICFILDSFFLAGYQPMSVHEIIHNNYPSAPNLQKVVHQATISFLGVRDGSRPASIAAQARGVCHRLKRGIGAIQASLSDRAPDGARLTAHPETIHQVV